METARATTVEAAASTAMGSSTTAAVATAAVLGERRDRQANECE
jgi:hypothetical protein